MIVKNVFSSTKNAILVSLLGVSSLLVSEPIVLAQSTHSSHHHLIVGWDELPTLISGNYAGLSNPNYGRLSLLFPHHHEPPENSHFHAIGIYTYTGPASSPTVVSTSTNNHIPETRFNLPPIPLFPGNGVFTGKTVSTAIEQNIYSDLKTKPVLHLTEDLDDPYIAAIYNTGNGRWNGLLGDEATIALELVSITPGLKVADTEGNELFTAGNTEIIGTGDDFTFTPKFYVDETAPIDTYSATFRLLDVNTDGGRTPLLNSGTFTLDFQQARVPEPSTVLGLAAIGLLALRGNRRHER